MGLGRSDSRSRGSSLVRRTSECDSEVGHLPCRMGCPQAKRLRVAGTMLQKPMRIQKSSTNLVHTPSSDY
jgi:hypothetical protein